MILQYLLETSLPLGTRILGCLFSLIAVLAALSIHEFSHGLAAYACGDDTAKSQGRLSFNPLAHLDPVGTIMLLLVGFGWAKPVQINPNRFKKVKLGIIVTALAGPLSNFILSFICAIIYSLFYLLYVVHSIEILFYIALLFMVTGSLSLGLGIFNLIPVPPLDGSRVLAECLPPKARYKYYQLERYSMIIFIGLLILLRTTNILGAIHTPIWEFFENIGISLFSWML